MKDRFRTLFDIRGLGWQLVIALVVLLVGALGVGTIVFWESLRDALSDFFTADVKVWHVLLTGAAVGIILAIWMRRAGKRKRRQFPAEVEHFGVIWPIQTVIVGSTPRFTPLMPACPKDRTTLGMAVKDDKTGKDFVVPLGGFWKELVSDVMRFGCFKDGSIYDLTEHGCGMEEALEIVVGQAQGVYRTALAAER